MAINRDCYYNCSSPPEFLYPNPDISGVGVLVGYTATAGIVVLILVLHYHYAYDPTKNPFRKENETSLTASPNPRINPIDVVYLGTWSKIRLWLLRSSNKANMETYPRLEAAFVKCVQSMSDLQILTGISILISGYVQLNCGLLAFHWQLIVMLAWFSSITHLCCLTFLRNHLYNRPAERMGRLIAMGMMLVMLLVAMVPTSGYNWTDNYYSAHNYPSPAPSDYAICYLQPSVGGSSKEDYDLNLATMVISVILLTLGFIHRIIRLHESLSVNLIGYARSILSEKARKILLQTYTAMDMGTSGLTWKRLFLYRPLLALFLTLRSLLDLWNSMFIETLWMVGSFIWGLIRLLQTLQIDDGGSSDWSFGQVIPVVLLAAPLLTIFESFSQETPVNSPLPDSVQTHTTYPQFDHSNTLSNTRLQDRDHPNRDFYQNSNWTHSLICLMVAYVLGTTIEYLIFVGTTSTKLLRLLTPTVAFPSYPPIYLVLNIWIFITFSMLIEDIVSTEEDLRTFMGIKIKSRYTMKGYIIGYLSLFFTGGFLNPLSDMYPLAFPCLIVGFYLVFSVVVVLHSINFHS